MLCCVLVESTTRHRRWPKYRQGLGAGALSWLGGQIVEYPVHLAPLRLFGVPSGQVRTRAAKEEGGAYSPLVGFQVAREWARRKPVEGQLTGLGFPKPYESEVGKDISRRCRLQYSEPRTELRPEVSWRPHLLGLDGVIGSARSTSEVSDQSWIMRIIASSSAWRYIPSCVSNVIQGLPSQLEHEPQF